MTCSDHSRLLLGRSVGFKELETSPRASTFHLAMDSGTRRITVHAAAAARSDDARRASRSF